MSVILGQVVCVAESCLYSGTRQTGLCELASCMYLLSGLYFDFLKFNNDQQIRSEFPVFQVVE